jgi:hypothetical protein
VRFSFGIKLVALADGLVELIHGSDDLKQFDLINSLIYFPGPMSLVELLSGCGFVPALVQLEYFVKLKCILS